MHFFMAFAGTGAELYELNDGAWDGKELNGIIYQLRRKSEQ
jgi:hypothetical protein